MNYLSVCSGIEAATVAWHPLGWNPVAFSEIENFPCSVLEHHYPNVPNMGDMTKFKEWSFDQTIDLLVGGTPCQSFSVAGLRKGLDDPRGNLMLTYLAIADKFRPKWLVLENVPGVLSSNKGKDFGSLLGGLAELGYGFAYRVLDAQYFGLAQRRKRVFVVGCLGDWRSAAAVLFERDSLQGNPAPQRDKKQDVAGTITTSVGKCDQAGSAAGLLIATFDRQSSGEYGTAPIASTMSARDYKSATDLVAYGVQASIIGRQDHNGGNGLGFSEEVAPTLTNMDRHGVVSTPFGINGHQDVGHCLRSDASKADKPDSTTYVVHGTQDPCVSDVAFALGRNNGQENALVDDCQVRRLTPTECERLQGFHDGYTQVLHRGKPAADDPRYKALGNSMAVPVMAWIGERIQMVEELQCVVRNAA